MSIDQLQNVAMNVVEGVCSIIARPIELILRPWHGTRYFPVPVVFFSTMLMVFLPLLSAVATGLTQLIPGAGVRPPVGLFGIGSLSKLYFLLSFIHGIRLWWLMIHLEKEVLSEFEGAPLPFFRLLPGSASFWATRIIWEPIVLLCAVSFLERMLIINSGLAFFLNVAAFSLGMKEYIAWYRAWEFLRGLLDAKFAGPIIAKLVEGTATSEDLAAIHMASFPENLAPEIRKEAALHIARVISREGK
jgi:hypothetical protein